LGVAAGAERLVTHRGEHHGIDFPIHRGPPESEDGSLYHVRRVGVVLLGVVEDDPGVVQPFRHRTVPSLGGSLLVANHAVAQALHLPVDQVVVDQGCRCGSLDNLVCSGHLLLLFIRNCFNAGGILDVLWTVSGKPMRSIYVNRYHNTTLPVKKNYAPVVALSVTTARKTYLIPRHCKLAE